MKRRTTDVLAKLGSDPRFARTGKTKASRWALASPIPSFDDAEAAIRWNCDVDVARETIFGRDGFLERGYVQSVHGNGRVFVTDLNVSAAIASLDGMCA